MFDIRDACLVVMSVITECLIFVTIVSFVLQDVPQCLIFVIIDSLLILGCYSMFDIHDN